MNLKSRAKRLFGRDKALSEHTVVASKVEHSVFNDVRRRAAALDEAVSTPPVLPSGDTLDSNVWERLAEDAWSELYGLDEPTIRGRDKIDPKHRVSRELTDKQARSAEFTDLHAMTRGEITESALGVMSTLSTWRESYGAELAEHAERTNDIADAERGIDALDDDLEALRKRRAEDPSNVEEIDELIREAAKHKRDEVNALKDAVAAQAANAGSLIDAARAVAQAAAQDAKATIEVASLMPGSQAGSGSRVGVDAALNFANRVFDSGTLRMVLEMMGRLQLSMGSTRRQLRKGGYDEMVDIETGADLRLVLQGERALLTHPMGKLDFYRRYAERSLMQYEMWSEEEQKKGPLIVAADGSGSMAGAPNVFCRGLTLACCGIANREGRTTAAVEFGSSGQLREFQFPAGSPLDTETVIEFAEHFYNGGTDINQVLLRAYDLINAEAPFHSADLVIVTDGGDRVTESTIVLRDALRAKGVKIHGLAINSVPTEYLLTVCDSTSSVFDFAGPNSTSDRLAIDIT